MLSNEKNTKTDNLKEANLYIAGFTGLIGSELTSIISETWENLKKKNIEINIIGKLNSKIMILNNVEEKANFDIFLENLVNDKAINKIFVDCTASEFIANKYHEILSLGVSVVTANKIANSSDYKYFEKLKLSANKFKTKYLYETNVGAGLPVIKTLKELIDTGDEIIKIEGILSGTLSYIFNSFKGDLTFSKVVKTAKEKGFTEPNPESDLTGMDVARKILILIRECGYNFEMKDLEVENLVPEEMRNSKSSEEFFENLEKFDNYFENMKVNTENNGKKLRYVASFENGTGTVKLMQIDEKHPFYNLEGSDNVVSFYTKRYENPLTIKGAGAGASVTAAGVYSDILKAMGSC